MHPALSHLDHRPWPLPRGRWVMAQTWHDLLFAHWPTEERALRPLVPAELPLDTFQGQCWVAVAPFHMSGIYVRPLPALPGLSRFPELNVRTYVTLEGKPGVYFFSLDAANIVAVRAARTFYRLPYFLARMSVRTEGDRILYKSRRDSSAEFQANYGPVGPVTLRPAGTLENWLTERYCLYAVTNRQIYRAEIHHRQWPLQDAEAAITTNTMAAAAGITLPDAPPLLHFSRRLGVLIWPLRKL